MQAVLAAEGIDATPEEIRDVVLEELGSELTEEQLAGVAGGLDDVQIGLISAGIVEVGVVAAAAAAF